MRRGVWRALVVGLALSAAARASDLSLEDIATAEREEKAALAKVEAAHGNKPPRELSAGERVQIIREQQEASKAVYAQRSLDAKTFATRVARLTPAERAQVDAEKARMDQEEKERLEREAAAANAEPQPLEITRGVDEKHPVDLYRAPDEPEVEHLSEGGEPEEAPAAKPQKAHGKPASGPKNPSHGKKSRHK